MKRNMDKAKVKFLTKEKTVELDCEIAKSLFQKMEGLMNREKLEESTGMLFLFKIPWIRIFWMKNVKINLDIIFVNRNNEIISIYNAPVEKGFFYKKYWSRGFCKFVIETKMGFCKKNKIKKGMKIRIQ